MTLSNTIAAHASSLFLSADRFGEEVLRHPRGDRRQQQCVTAVFEEETDPLRLRDAGGDRTERSGTLHLAADQDVHDDDEWTIGGERWQTGTVRGPEHGLREIVLRRTDTRARRKNRDLR